MGNNLKRLEKQRGGLSRQWRATVRVFALYGDYQPVRREKERQGMMAHRYQGRRKSRVDREGRPREGDSF